MYICTQNENFQLEYGFYLTTNNKITTNNTTTNNIHVTTNNTAINNIIHTCIPLVVYQRQNSYNTPSCASSGITAMFMYT